MNKYKLITDFSKYTADGLVSFGNHVNVCMTGNTNLVNPSPPLSNLRLFTDNLSNANANMGINKVGTVTRDAARATLEAYFKSLASYVQENSNNDPAIMLSSGFDLVKARSPIGPMPMPENLGADCIKGIAGSVRLTVAPVLKATGYVWQYTEFPMVETSVWQSDFSTTANITLALKPRTEYVFCVAAMATDPTRTFSEKLTFFVV